MKPVASITSRNQNHRRGIILSQNPFVEWIIENKSILSLSGLAISSTLIYGFGFIPIANLLKLYPIPRLTLKTLPQGGVPGLRRVILAFLLLSLIYWLAWRLVRHLHGKAAWMIVLGGSLISAIPLLFIYPFDAADIFDNILHGRILGVYASNPFLLSPSRFASDPFYRYVGWKGWPSAYGPGWEMIAGTVARLAGEGVIANVLAFKMIAGVFLLASLSLVMLIVRERAPEHTLASVFLLGWNPVVLYETWGHGHNDMAFVFWILLAALALHKRRYTLAILALVAGALFKFIPILLIPPTLALALRKLRNPRRRLAFLASVTLLSILLIVLAYVPFWEGVNTLSIDRRTRLYSSSLPSTIYNILLTQDWSKQNAAAIVSKAALVLTFAFTFWRSRGVWKSPVFEDLLEAGAQILLFYLLVTCLWFQNWYSLWLAGFVPLLRPGLTRRLALLVGFAALSKPLAIGPKLFWPQTKLAQPWLEIYFTLGVLGVPWIYWLLSSWKTKRDCAAEQS